jgi:hypothetical protein
MINAVSTSSRKQALWVHPIAASLYLEEGGRVKRMTSPSRASRTVGAEATCSQASTRVATSPLVVECVTELSSWRLWLIAVSV